MTQERAPWADSLFTDANDNWATIDDAHMTRLFRAYDLDSAVRALVQIKLDAVLSSDIVISGTGVPRLSPAQCAVQSEQWKRWCAQVYRSTLCCGWAAVRMRPVTQRSHSHTSMPEVLDLTRVEKRYYLDIGNTPHVRYFDTSNAQTRELHNIISLWTDPPDATGRLRSVLATLQNDIEFEKRVTEFGLQAWERCANPPLVTERRSALMSDENTHTASGLNRTSDQDFMQPFAAGKLGNSSSSSSGSATPHPAGVSDQARSASNKIAMEIKYNLVQALNNGHGDVLRYCNTQIDRMAGQYANGFDAQQVYLEPGRQLARPNDARAPDIVMSARVARLERVGAVLGVPISMITTDTSSSRAKLNAGSSPNSLIVFENGVRATRLQFRNFIHQLYCESNHKAISLHAIEHARVFKPHDDDDDDARQHVRVSMSALPPDHIVNELYEASELTRDAMMRYKCSRWGLMQEDFEINPPDVVASSRKRKRCNSSLSENDSNNNDVHSNKTKVVNDETKKGRENKE